MDNLEKNLSNLPKPGLSRSADLKIRWRIHMFIFGKNLSKIMSLLQFRQQIFTKVALTILVMVFILGMTSAYAYANDDITLGNTLYPLKKAVENVQQNLSLSKDSRVDALNSFSEKRMKEALNLVEDKGQKEKKTDPELVNNNIKETIDEAVKNIDSAVKTSQQIKDIEKAQTVKDKIKKQNDSLMQYLEVLGDKAKTGQDKEVLDKVEETKEIINKYNEKLDKDNREHSENIKKKSKDSETKPEKRGGEEEADQQNDRFERRSGNDDFYRKSSAARNILERNSLKNINSHRRFD